MTSEKHLWPSGFLGMICSTLLGIVQARTFSRVEEGASGQHALTGTVPSRPGCVINLYRENFKMQVPLSNCTCYCGWGCLHCMNKNIIYCPHISQTSTTSLLFLQLFVGLIFPQMCYMDNRWHVRLFQVVYSKHYYFFKLVSQIYNFGSKIFKISFFRLTFELI